MSRGPVLLLWGEDPFLLREAATEALGSMPRTEVEASEWRGGELSDLATPSLFGERRALIIDDVRSLPDEGMRELTTYLSSPDPDAPLLLLVRVGERGKPAAALTKLVEPVGAIREIAVARKDLPGWLVTRARARGIDLGPDAAAALVATIGEEAGSLASAVEQLGAAFPGTRIGRAAVEQQFRGLGEQHVWDLCDRAFERRLPEAIRALRSMLEAGDADLAILGGLATRLRDLMRVRALPSRMPPAELAKAAGLRFDWQAKRYRDQASGYALEDLVGLHRRLVEADLALKTGADGSVVLPILVAEIVTAGARGGS